MKRIASAALITVAAAALSACSSNSRWEPSPAYQPAKQVKLTPAELRPAPQARQFVPKAAKASTRKRRQSEMCGFAWCIPDFDVRQLHIVHVKNGELTSIIFPPGERIEGQFFGPIGNAFDEEPVGACSGGRCRLAVKPITLSRSGDIEVVTSENAYRFLLVPSKNFYRAVDILGVVDDGGIAFPAEPKPDVLMPSGRFQKLAVIPLDDDELPPGAPHNVWTDAKKMVVELPGDFPLPVFLAGKKGDAVVQYSVHEYVSRSGQKIVAYVTRRPITEAMLHGEDWRVQITAGHNLKSSGWKRAEAMPDDAADLAYTQPEPRRGSIHPADVPANGGGIFGDEIDQIIQENNRRKRPIAGTPPEGIPIVPEEVI